MLSYPSGPLSKAAETALSRRQAQVDAEPDTAARRAAARRLFSKTRGKIFDEIRTRLKDMSPPGEACFYCERDRHREIDHVRPIRYFPELCFDWQNYVYACSICNQDSKRDRYAVIDASGELIAFDRSAGLDAPLPTGTLALIDIRQENPLDFLSLDLETGLFIANGPDAGAKKRGTFTRDLFDLNSDILSRIRRHAIQSFNDYLTRYARARHSGDPVEVCRIRAAIGEQQHPTVLAEMRRQAKYHPRLNQLLAGLPAWPEPL